MTITCLTDLYNALIGAGYTDTIGDDDGHPQTILTRGSDRFVISASFDTIDTAIHHWLMLADDSRGDAAYAVRAGRYAGVHIRKAELYRRTAASLRLKQVTGERHCIDHLRSDCASR